MHFMRSRVVLRLASALFLGCLLMVLLPSCGARAPLDSFVGGGGEGGGGACHDLGQSCGAATSCCGDLVCKQGLCKPLQICHPDGEACTFTSDCCAFDCLNGFCG